MKKRERNSVDELDQNKELKQPEKIRRRAPLYEIFAKRAYDSDVIESPKTPTISTLEERPEETPDQIALNFKNDLLEINNKFRGAEKNHNIHLLIDKAHRFLLSENLNERSGALTFLDTHSNVKKIYFKQYFLEISAKISRCSSSKFSTFSKPSAQALLSTSHLKGNVKNIFSLRS